MTQEVLKLALEALEDACGECCNAEYNPCFQRKAITAIKKALAQPEQGPVAWGVFEGNLHDMFFTETEAVEMAQLKGNHAEVKPLYTAPQRTWVGLTEEDDIDWEDGGNLKDLVKAIEAKLKQKNGYAEEKNT